MKESVLNNVKLVKVMQQFIFPIGAEEEKSVCTCNPNLGRLV